MADDGCIGRMLALSAVNTFHQDYNDDEAGWKENCGAYVGKVLDGKEGFSQSPGSADYHQLDGYRWPQTTNDELEDNWNITSTRKAKRIPVHSSWCNTRWGMEFCQNQCHHGPCRLHGTQTTTRRCIHSDWTWTTKRTSKIDPATIGQRSKRATKIRPQSIADGWERGRRLTWTNRGHVGVIVSVVFILAGIVSSGDAFSSSSSSSCTADQCAVDFMRALDHDKVLIGSNLPYCTLLRNYGSCLNRTSRTCRGELKYHSLFTMVSTQIRDRNCTALIENRRNMATQSKNGKAVKSNWTSEMPDGTSNGGKCLFPYQHQKGVGGYRYCSMFGDPHLRTFDGQYETCRTVGAWPLLDNSYFGVQVTNDPVADGMDASGISKITVIVKSLPGCSDQKMYEATKDSLPSTFVDGTWNSGDPNTNSVSGASYMQSSVLEHPVASGGDNRPAVLVRTEEIDKHVEIHMRYISTRVVIRRVGNYLTLAIKIPEEVLSQRTSLNSLQVCLTGCPSVERINYKEVLAYPEYYVKKWGARNPAMSRDEAVDICRRTGVTDFFFDSCVFDLLMTGDESFKESALAAMNDIRQLYPPYRKHYETQRADLFLYDELAKLGRRMEETEERERGHKRRQPAGHWDSDPRSQPSTSSGDRISRTSDGADSKRPVVGMLWLVSTGLIISFLAQAW